MASFCFDAARSGTVAVEVFDLLGRRVAVVMGEAVGAGRFWVAAESRKPAKMRACALVVSARVMLLQ